MFLYSAKQVNEEEKIVDRQKEAKKNNKHPLWLHTRPAWSVPATKAIKYTHKPVGSGMADQLAS